MGPLSSIFLQPQNIVARQLHCSEIIKKRHIQTHFKVKIVYMYSFVSKKKQKKKTRKKWSDLYSVIFREWGLE